MALTNLVNKQKGNSSQTQQAPTQQAPTHKAQEPKIPKAKKAQKESPKAPTQKEKPKPASDSKNLFVQELGRELRKAELWLSNPGVGKTTLAKNVSEKFLENGQIEDYAIVNCHEELTVMSILKTTRTDEHGNWKFLLNKVFNMLTDATQAPYIVVFDEYNTLPMSVQKSLQPIIDDTEGKFDFEDKEYTKNPNVTFILTMNHRDLGTNMLPDAILDRTFKVFFEDLTNEQLAQRSGVPEHIIETIGKVRKMFEHLADLPEFHKSVRRLKDIKGLTGEQFKNYITSELELAGVEWQQVTKISPEFEALIEEFDKIDWERD